MSRTAEKTDPKLWDKIKGEVTAGDKGGRPGQWSARKAQLASTEYQKAGGGYKGAKAPDNSLEEWTEQDWGTKSGKSSEATGERYLPKAARDDLSSEDYARTSAKKREDTKKGKQFSAQPQDVAAKTKPYRDSSPGTKEELYAEAKRRGISGRSKMNKADLISALA